MTRRNPLGDRPTFLQLVHSDIDLPSSQFQGPRFFDTPTTTHSMPRGISPALSTAPSTSPTAFDDGEREEQTDNIEEPTSTQTGRGSATARSLAYLRETIPPRSLTAPLLFISLACGILDATTYADFGTFASNQTG